MLKHSAVHASVVPCTKLLGVHHDRQQVLARGQVDDWVEGLMQDGRHPRQVTTDLWRPVLALAQLCGGSSTQHQKMHIVAAQATD